jgi:predicted methyltransferase MtxX (methanogen marker protein 4)
MAPDGVTGNLIFRSLHFLGARRAFGAPVVNIDQPFVDTSRAKTDFSDPVLLAAGLAEVRGLRKKRA